MFFAALFGLFRDKAQQRVDQLLEAVGLEDAADKRFDRYSSGMKQRLAIARGLIHSPQILFLDEPGRSLDTDAKQNVYNLILKLNKTNGMTVFLISHDKAEVDTLCTRVGIMRGGAFEIQT